MIDGGDSIPIITLPLLLLGPEGAVAYLAINLVSCATAEEPPRQFDQPEHDGSGDVDIDADGIDADGVDMEFVDMEYEDADVPEESLCEPGDYRPCGPCDLGIEFCEPDHTWSGKCDGVVDFVFRAGAVVVNRTDIAIAEVESCNFVYP